MSLSETLYQLQVLDSELDKSLKRIAEIDLQLKDKDDLNKAIFDQERHQAILSEKQKILRNSEQLVEDQNLKIDQNQKKLYSGTITNPKELEDLQMEASSLGKYLSTLEERQLEAMIEFDQASQEHDQAVARVENNIKNIEKRDSALLKEKNDLEEIILRTREKKQKHLDSSDIPNLSIYQELREELNGIAVTLMVSGSCSSCGSNIPSAIAQEVRSPLKTTNCPTCKRILHPGE
jgi:predicted  nucleic acid-binding Zn-ribbon protein